MIILKNYLVNKKTSFFILYLLVFSLAFSNLTEYYESNEFGVAFREIHSSQLTNYKYVLIYENRGALETRRLLENNKEIARWERRNRFTGTYIETEYKDNEVRLVVHYSGGRLVKEEIYFEGSVSEIREYNYRSNNLIETVLYNAKGDFLYSHRYTKDSRGRLISASKYEKVEEDKIIETASFSFQYSGQFLSMQIFIEGDNILKFIYSQGRLSTIEETQKGELIYKKDFPLDNKVSSEKDFLKNEHIDRAYDKNEKITKETLINKDGSKSIITYSYDDDGLLIEKNIRAPKLREKYIYEYDEDEKLSYTEYFINNKLVWSREYTSLRDYIESTYKSGQVVYKAMYTDQQFVKSLYIGVELDSKVEEIEDASSEQETGPEEIEDASSEQKINEKE